MPKTSSYDEFSDSQKPALELLQTLGYKLISPKDALKSRRNLYSNVLLESILEKKLKELNKISYKNETHEFSQANIFRAIDDLKRVSELGLVKNNEKVYELLTMGKALSQTIRDDKKSFQLKYIDWENIENNDFHVTYEFSVSGKKKTRRADIVCFVNGIPFVVIECKRRDKDDSTDEAINQLGVYQTTEEGVPQLFNYNQLLLAAQPNEVKYATVGTPKRFWSVWKNKAEDCEQKVSELLNGRLPTEQDKIFYTLLRPKMLMDLSYKFILYDFGGKKIARYQQFYAVRSTIERVKEFSNDDKRKGGVIWHTQGSGKSLTMVMLAKSLSLEPSIKNPRVILVTDRVDLDKQIWETFRNCGKEPKRARTGRHLIELLKNPDNEIITTIINKFETANKKSEFANDSKNIFVLVDESHRSQYGLTHQKMKNILPNACYIGFTGTPLLKKEKSTSQKFGGIIHKYTLEEGVKDEAIIPLLYEGRLVKLEINKKQIDKGFSRASEGLSQEQQKDLKKKFATEEQIFCSKYNVEEVAYDISKHFRENLQGTIYKAQIAAPSKLAGLDFYKYFQEEGKINASLVISPPEKSEGEEEDDSKGEIQKFSKMIKEKFGNEKEYEKQVIDKFKSVSKDVEILIVVDKYLTGFDAPRNTVLYIAKKLKEHNLLQAIARVNRKFEGKDFGYIIDYRGILGELNEALNKYSALADFDNEDIEGTLTNILEEIEKLPTKYDALWKIFEPVKNILDTEEVERFLADRSKRENFYERFLEFSKSLSIAVASEQFHQKTPKEEIEKYLKDLKFFQKLRFSVKRRFADAIDFKAYEPKIKKLLDSEVKADEVIQITEPVNIFDDKAFAEAVENVTGKSNASVADSIAHALQRKAIEKMEEDPSFYEKFSRMLREVIKKFYEKRIDELAYLNEILELRKDFLKGGFKDTPEILTNKPEARAYYGILQENFGAEIPSNETFAEMGIEISKVVESIKIIDWQTDPDFENKFANAVEDFLVDFLEAKGLEVSFEKIDLVIEKAISLTMKRG